MTADHPTREERYAAAERVIERMEATQTTGNDGLRLARFAADLRAALVAADPAPAQPDAALSEAEREALHRIVHVRLFQTDDDRLAALVAAVERILAARAAQPEDGAR